MKSTQDIGSLSREDLLGLVAEQQRLIDQLQSQVTTLTASNQALRAEIAVLKRSSKRQAAPFSKGTRVSKPKRPGRKPGSGSFSFRQDPQPEEVTEPPVDVPVTMEACPECGGTLEEERVDLAYITDIPPMPRPKVTEYRVSVCHCSQCGHQVRGQHPDVAPDQFGATAHRVGSRTMAAAHTLHYGVGIPVRKVPWVLEVLMGVQLTQGAITRDALRRARGTVGQVYQGLRNWIRESSVVYTDDTGWRVGGERAFLMVFETPEATVYQVRPRHRHQEVQEVIPPDYQGVMVTDRGPSYDAKALSPLRQQKCLSHILESIKEVVEAKQGRGRSFGNQLKRLLQEAMELWRGYHAGEVEDLPAAAKPLQESITRHLRNRVLPDRDNQRLLDEIGWHHDRGNLLRFLEDPRIEPTNNRAERALRPAVIARKVSQCSKNDEGAYAFSAFKSVVQTLAKRGIHSMVEGLNQVFRSGSVQGIPP